MKSDTLLIAECAEYLPPELLKELARRLDREWGRIRSRSTREDVEEALPLLLYQYDKWRAGIPSNYDAMRRAFLSIFPEDS